MLGFLKQSTAVTLKIGPFVDATDGITPETGLTIAQANVRLSKNGANIAAKNEATSCTYDETALYDCPLDATDTNTLGILQLGVIMAGALPVYHDYAVVTANVYDTLFSTDTFDVNVTTLTAALDFTATMKTSVGTAVWTTPATRELSASGIDAFWDETLTAHVTADSAGLALKNLLKIGKNKWKYDGTTFTIYDDNGSSVLYQFTLDSATAATQRTPV